MAVDKRLFLGIKQMTKSAFSGLDDSEKVGYIWFVRCEDPVHFEIYLGTKLYGETNEIIDSKINEIVEKLRVAIGLTEDLTLPDDYKYENILDELEQHDIRLDNIDVALEKEKKDRIAADSALTIALEKEIADRIESENEIIDAINEVITNLDIEIEDRIAADSALTIALEDEINERKESVSALTEEVLRNEEVVADAIIRLKDRIGLDKFFDLPERFRLYSSITDGVYTKEEIDEKIHGLFKFKGVFEYLSELLASGETVEGYVYQAVYRDVEQTEEGEWIPVDPPVLANSEFAYDGEKWVELGPLFDEREIEELREIVDSHTECLESINVVSDEFIYNLFYKYLSVEKEGTGGCVLSGSGSYFPGTTVRISVETDENSKFLRWKDGVTSNIRNVVVSDSPEENVYIAEVYLNDDIGVVIPSIKEGQEEMGTVDGGGSGLTGETVVISAMPGSKSVFKQWIIDDIEEPIMNPITEVEITKTGKIKAIAEFEYSDFDEILNNLDTFGGKRSYKGESGYTDEYGNYFYIYGAYTPSVTALTISGDTDNRSGWSNDEETHYEHLLYTGISENNIVFVECGVKSNEWYNKDRRINSVTKISGEDGLDRVRFNYGWAFYDAITSETQDNEVLTTNPDLHLLVKIYSGKIGYDNSGLTETENNLVAVYAVTKKFEDWGYSYEGDKILNRPFIFDSLTSKNLVNNKENEILNIEGDYLITIRNYFSKTDLVKNSGETPEEYYIDTFDDVVFIDPVTGEIVEEGEKLIVDGREIVKPLTRLCIDNIGISLVSEKRNNARERLINRINKE